MLTTRELLQDVLTRYKLTSFQQLADLIGTSRQAIHQQLDGGSMRPLHAVKVAELLNLDALKVLAATQAEQARTDDERACWERLYHLRR